MQRVGSEETARNKHSPTKRDPRGCFIGTLSKMGLSSGSQTLECLLGKCSRKRSVRDPQNLETRMNTEKKSCNEDVRNEKPEFTQDEVQAATDDLKKR